MLFTLSILFFNVFIITATHAAEKIRVSVSGSYNMIFLAAGVAQHKGFFKDEGLDADIVVMSAPASLAALSNCDIDYTPLTGSVIRAAIRGLPVRIVAGLMSSSAHVFLSSPEIKTIKELSGKRIGLAGVGVSQKSLQSNRSQVKRVIKSLMRANRFMRENREGSVKPLIAWGKGKPEVYASYDSTVKNISPDSSIPDDGLKILIDQAKRDVKVTRDVSLSEIADFTLLREVQKELGLR